MATPQYMAGEQGVHTSLNITAPTVIYARQGKVFNVSVLVSPTAAGGVYDAATTAGNVQANMILPLGAGAVGIFHLGGTWVFNGLLVDPGTGGAVSVNWT
ncbi:MAG: hypothetical protein ACYC0Z_14980 [Acidobacteriaceae bacterium]